MDEETECTFDYVGDVPANLRVDIEGWAKRHPGRVRFLQFSRKEDFYNLGIVWHNERISHSSETSDLYSLLNTRNGYSITRADSRKGPFLEESGIESALGGAGGAISFKI
jgi:hypothetical protein